MRGTWDDVNRRLASSLLSLDMGDCITVGDRVATTKHGRFSRAKPVEAPRRWVRVTATWSALHAECVGAKDFGGEWAMSPETRETLEKMGWQPPWSPDYPVFQRDAPLQKAPVLANAMARTLRELGCEVEGIEATLTKVDTESQESSR